MSKPSVSGAGHIAPGESGLLRLPPLRQAWNVLTRYRALTWELTRREVTDRYNAQLLGPAWAIGHPLLLMGIYVFLFTYVFPHRWPEGTSMPRSFPVYILAGLIPWMTFGEVMSKSSTVIIGSAGLAKQIAFPLEVLPVKTALGAFFGQLVATCVLLLVMLVGGGGWPWTLVLAPVIFLLQVIAMTGVCYALSAAGVFFRDLKEFVQVFLAAGLFLAPILYLPEMVESVWAPLRFVLLVNPFSHMVWCFQDVFYFGHIAHPVSWVTFVSTSLIVWYGGGSLFARLRHLFGDAL
jgi:lipopolysaccharide transport system permease protein